MRLRYTKLTLTTVLLSLSGLLYLLPVHAEAPTGTPAILKSDETGIVLNWQSPGYSITTQSEEGKLYTLITMPGLELSDKPGQPQLPVYSALIGLPPTGSAKIRISNIEQETVQLEHPILPGLTPVPVSLQALSPNSLPTEAMTLKPDAARYATNAFYPADPAQLSQAQQIRFQRVAGLQITPVQVNPVTGEAIIIRSMTVEITFEQPADRSNAEQSKNDPFTRILANTLLNPEALAWEKPSPSPTPSLEGGDFPPLPDRGRAGEGLVPPYKIIVPEPGLYELSYSALQNAGLPVDTLTPSTFKLSHGVNRQPVAIQVEGEGDGSFDSGDRILFYAAPDYSRYTDEIVYFLDYSGAVGARMVTRSGSPGSLPGGTPWVTLNAEEDKYYQPTLAARNGDHWYWESIYPELPLNITLPLSTPQTGVADAQLTLWLHGFTNTDHRISATINGAAIPGEVSWHGNSAPVTGTLSVPASALQNGNNQLVLSANVSNEAVWFDALQLTYASTQADSGQHWFSGESGPKKYALQGVANGASVYDITQPFTPQIASDFTLASGTLTVGDADASAADYLIVEQAKTPTLITRTQSLTDPVGGADYIIITHPDFASAIAPLAAHRQAITGANAITQVVTADINAVYDTFGDGRMDAEAIKRYLQHAWDTWTLKPEYVLLVGDGHYDFNDNLGWGNPIFIPPYLADVDPWLGETASDNQLATLSGSDNFPDVMIGRLSVNTPTEAQTVVDKIIHYETDPPIGEWNARHIFVAAKEEGSGHFHDNADKAYTHTVQVAPLRGYRYYYDPDGGGSEFYLYTNVNDLRSAFFSSYNAGAGVSVYHGHSSWHQWASNQSAPLYDLLHLNDVSSFHNGYRLPVMLEMTCYTGYFHHPEYATLDEALLRHSGGGAIAVWGATGLGFTKGHDKLQEGFYEKAINDSGIGTLPSPAPTVGESVLAGKLQLFSPGGSNQDLLDTFTLFGDPAMTINLEFVPFPEHVYLPVVLKQ